MIPARGPQTMFFCQWLLWNHCRVIGMLCYAMLLLACLLAAAVVYASTELLSEHNVTDVPRGTSVTKWLLCVCYALLYAMLCYAAACLLACC